MFKKILVPVDIDRAEAVKGVYEKAMALAEQSGAEVRLVCVMPDFGMPLVASFISEDVRKEATTRFKESVEKYVEEHCDDAVTAMIRTGKTWEQIIKAAEKWGADLIVVYHNRRNDINEVFSRSCSQRVQDNAKCSVLRLRHVQG